MSAQRVTPVIVSLMLAQSLSGLLFPAQYRDAEWIKATWFGNDWVTLVIAVPLLVSTRALAKRSVRSSLLWAGILGTRFTITRFISSALRSTCSFLSTSVRL